MKIAVLLTAVDKMSQAVNNAVVKSQAKLAGFSKVSEAMAQKSFGFGKSTGALGLGSMALLAGPLKAAADMERMQIALKTAMGGSAKEGDRAFKIISKFADRTPYEMEEVMTGFVKLKNMGLDPSTKALTSYGNTAAAMGKNLNDMIEAVADAATGEFERLKEFGIRASSQGSKVMFTFKGVTTAVQKDSKSIEAYLKRIGNVHFGNGIADLANSIWGQWSTLNDSIRKVSASIGKVLIPPLNALFKKMGPIMEKVEAWVNVNPKLTRQIVTGVAAFGAFNLALSGSAFVFGGVFKAMGIYGKVIGSVTKAMNFLKITTAATSAVTKLLMANGIILGITAIAAGAYLIYKNWGPIKTWFSKLWTGISNAVRPVITTLGKYIYNFTPIGWIMRLWKPMSRLFGAIWNLVKTVFVVAFKGLKFLFLNFTPAGLVVKHWDKLAPYFIRIWDTVKNIFTKVVKFVFNIGKMFFNAGANIISSIIAGITSKIDKITGAIQRVTQKVRDFFPFSPAKTGPLRDIHRVKLIETIATSINAKPLTTAMNRVTGSIAAFTPARPQLATVPRGGGNIVLHSNITVNGGNKRELEEYINMRDRDLLNRINEAQRLRDRTRF